MRDGQEEPVKDRKRRNVGVREGKRLRQREWKASQSVNMPVSFVGKGRHTNSSNTHETSNRTQHTHTRTQRLSCVQGRRKGGLWCVTVSSALALIPSALAVTRLEFFSENWSA